MGDNEADFVCTLFAKYINHVGEVEGVTFTNSFAETLTEDERAYLQMIKKEAEVL